MWNEWVVTNLRSARNLMWASEHKFQSMPVVHLSLKPSGVILKIHNQPCLADSCIDTIHKKFTCRVFKFKTNKALTATHDT